MSWIDAQGREHQAVIAEQDAVVHDPFLGIDRQIVAGQPVPPELTDAYQQRHADAKKSQPARKQGSDSAADARKTAQSTTAD